LGQLARGEAIGTVEMETTVQPADIQNDVAEQAVASANRMVEQSFTFSSENKTYTLTPSELVQWVAFDINKRDGTIGVGVDDVALADTLPQILNRKVANPPVNRRILYSPEGNLIAYQTWGTNGTMVAEADAANAVTAMSKAFGAVEPLNFKVKTVPKEYDVDKVTVGGAYDKPNGSKWIDVNQRTYKVTLYAGTTFIKQFTCVIGAPGTPTVTGTFYINRKYSTTSMRGRNSNGTEYYVAYVPWTMYFYGGYALHGAPWRSSFGYRASHGCVNLRVSDAKWVFNWAPLGTRVVSHW